MMDRDAFLHQCTLYHVNYSGKNVIENKGIIQNLIQTNGKHFVTSLPFFYILPFISTYIIIIYYIYILLFAMLCCCEHDKC